MSPERPRAVLTVGTFDGVHRGHRLVLDRLRARATAEGATAGLVTFAPHPLEVVNPAAAPPLLTTHEEKLEALTQSAIDSVVVLPFTPTLAQYDAPQFVDHVLRERFGMTTLLVGYDHGFGRGRSGDAQVLQALGADRGFAVEVVPPVQMEDGQPISSTMIRRAVAGGDLARAAAALGRPYAVSGVVVEGAGRGRSLGFRTLNIALGAERKLLPPEGVYAIRAQTRHGAFDGMVNLGPRPTFGEAESRLEAHLFDADGDWYGSRVRIDLIARLRETRRFESPAALMAQLAVDERDARARLRAAR
ncbi:MAG: bifunctional riboflavin kinase/FAD synthetase [Gemmatimonadaceae bacterium]|nr:bifunctional riboflavin kinase/FAD synthetase [Gemmatimonadaceae bacterium]